MLFLAHIKTNTVNFFQDETKLNNNYLCIDYVLIKYSQRQLKTVKNN